MYVDERGLEVLYAREQEIGREISSSSCGLDDSVCKSGEDRVGKHDLREGGGGWPYVQVDEVVSRDAAGQSATTIVHSLSVICD